MRDCKRKAWTNTSNISMSSLETSHTARIIVGIWEGFTNYLWSAGSTLRLWMSKTRLLWEGMRPLSLKWKTIRKERAHVLERKSTGADRGPGGAGDWSKKRMGRILQGCRGHPEHHPISWSGAGRRKRGFKRGQVLPKWNWIGNICAGGLFYQDNPKIYAFWPNRQYSITRQPHDNIVHLHQATTQIKTVATAVQYPLEKWSIDHNGLLVHSIYSLAALCLPKVWYLRQEIQISEQAEFNSR